MDAMKNTGRGGRREGSGRKKQVRIYSDKIKSALMKALRDNEKKTGKSWLQDLADMNQDEKVQDSVRIAAKKLIADILVVKESHRTTTEFQKGVIILPEMKDDPTCMDYSKLPEELKRQGSRELKH